MLLLYDIVNLARYVALQASDGLHLGVPLGHLLGDIFLGALVGPEPPYGDDVDRGVRLPVAAAVEPVPICHWIGYTYLDDFGRIMPAFLNSTGVMHPSVE